MAKHHLYDESPILEHEESGHVKVVKTPKKEEYGTDEEKGVEAEGFPVHARHAHERHLMHAKHEHEHAMHDHHSPHESKEPMHTRHEKEFADMHTRHEKETGEKSGAEGRDVGAPIKEIEKGAK